MPPVGADGTHELLERRGAIWCPPPRLRRGWPGVPQPGEKLWLLWRQMEVHQPTVLLGGGRILLAPRRLFGTGILWSDVDDRGLRQAAGALGYGGGNAMTFLRLENVVLSGDERNRVLEGRDLDSGLSRANEGRARLLQNLLEIL